jgi:membrane protein DedA with SNARE-associated domain
MAGMGKVRFAVSNAVGALVWATVFTAIGFYAAEWWRSTSQLVHIALAALLVVGAAVWWLTRRRKRSAQTSS